MLARSTRATPDMPHRPTSGFLCWNQLEITAPPPTGATNQMATACAALWIQADSPAGAKPASGKSASRIGKTVQSIAIASAYMQEEWPLVVMCPASLKTMWKNYLIKRL